MAVFDRMASVVFVNAFGKEAAIWRDLTGGQLTERFFEGGLTAAHTRIAQHARRRRLCSGRPGVSAIALAAACQAVPGSCPRCSD